MNLSDDIFSNVVLQVNRLYLSPYMEWGCKIPIPDRFKIESPLAAFTDLWKDLLSVNFLLKLNYKQQALNDSFYSLLRDMGLEDMHPSRRIGVI